MKKILSVVLCVGLIFGLCACGSSSDEKTYNIGVIQLVQHDALDKANEGFVDALKDRGFKDGKNITIDQQNASGDQSNCQSIADSFVNDKKDLVYAIATPAAQAIANKTTDIPIVISAVTDPKDAGLVKSNSKPGTNVTGTSDLTPVTDQIKLVKQIMPKAKKVGVSEVYGIRLLENVASGRVLEKCGFETFFTGKGAYHDGTYEISKSIWKA